MPDRRCCGCSRQHWREITLLPHAAFQSDISSSSLIRKGCSSPAMAKPGFPGGFYYYYLFILQTKAYLLAEELCIPLLPHKGCALGAFAPALPSWATAKSHPPHSAPCFGHHLLPGFGLRLPFALPCQQLRSIVQSHPRLFPAVSQMDPIHTPFLVRPKLPHHFTHHLVFLLHLPPLSR